ncbi:MAG: hypothetical protein J6B04_04820 [Clostridia bacterium]|nr:hypothetical protein [Clostridia bacterium]
MKIKNLFICIFLVTVAVIIIIYPERYVKCCFEGLLTWAECVVPALFPFAVISAILTKTGIAEDFSKPFYKVLNKVNLPECTAACFTLSALSGYPAGSRTVAEFYKNGAISDNNALKVAALCSTSGPLFIIGSVGFKMFGDKIIGVKILLAHFISVILVGAVFCLFNKNRQNLKPVVKKQTGNILYDCFYGAANAVLTAGAFIVFFYTVSKIMCDFNLLYPLCKILNLFFPNDVSLGICRGILEITGGCLTLSKSGYSYSVPICGFLITFGGISILLQQLSYLSAMQISAFKFILIKFLQAVACFLILLFTV